MRRLPGNRPALLGGQAPGSGLAPFGPPRLEQLGVLLEGPAEGTPVGEGSLPGGVAQGGLALASHAAEASPMLAPRARSGLTKVVLRARVSMIARTQELTKHLFEGPFS